MYGWMDLLQSLTKSRETRIPAAIDRAMCMNMIVGHCIMYQSKCLMICVNYFSHVLIMPNGIYQKVMNVIYNTFTFFQLKTRLERMDRRLTVAKTVTPSPAADHSRPQR